MEAVLVFLLDGSVLLTLPVCLLLAVLIATNGIEHGHIWARGGNPGDSWLLNTFPVHFVDEIQEVAYYLLALLSGANWIAIGGTIMASRILFEGAINLGVGRSFFDQGNEDKDFVVRAFGRKLYSRPKAQTKMWLLAKTVVGLALVASHPWISAWILTWI